MHIGTTIAETAFRCAIGLFGVALTLSAINARGRITSYQIGLVLPLFLGAYLIFDAPKRGYFLVIETAGGRKTLAFSGKPEPAELRAFIAEAGKRFGYQVEDELPADS